MYSVLTGYYPFADVEKDRQIQVSCIDLHNIYCSQVVSECLEVLSNLHVETDQGWRDSCY